MPRKKKQPEAVKYIIMRMLLTFRTRDMSEPPTNEWMERILTEMRNLVRYDHHAMGLVLAKYFPDLEMSSEEVTDS